MKFNKGDRVQTHSGVPATVRKTRFKKVHQTGKRVGQFCTVHFDCDRPGKTWDVPEGHLIALQEG